MMTICGAAVNFSVPLPKPLILPRLVSISSYNSRLRYVKVVRAAPEMMSDKVEKSVEEAKEVCSDDPKSGECVAAWDEVEELSAAASHNREREKETCLDPLEKYCQDHPETDECRIYDN